MQDHFENAIKEKKYLLVSVDKNSGLPIALLLPNLKTDRVFEFLVDYIARNGIPKQIRAEQGIAFKSETSRQNCKKTFNKHIICPVRDHRGNGKVEGMIRTINERLRKNKKIVVKSGKSEISNILFALRSEKGEDGKSAFEKHMDRKPNTLKSVMIEKRILYKNPLLEIVRKVLEKKLTLLSWFVNESDSQS